MKNALLKSVFGHDDFRPGQRGIDRRLAERPGSAGRDGHGEREIALLPVPGGREREALPGGVSADQLDERPGEESSSWPASRRRACIATLRPHERQQAMADWAAKRLRFLYVSPERFSDEGFTALLERQPAGLRRDR